MALATKDPGGVVVQAWVTPDLAEQLRAQAQLERRSVSSTIRLALEDQLRPLQRDGERAA